MRTCVLALLFAFAAAVALGEHVCQIATDDGVIDLSAAPIGWASNVPVNGVTHARQLDVGIGVCHAYDTWHNNACFGRNPGYFGLSSRGQDPTCLVSYSVFVTNWTWTGEAVVASFTDSYYAVDGTVTMHCDYTVNNTYENVTVSEDSRGRVYNVSLVTNYACPVSAATTMAPGGNQSAAPAMPTATMAPAAPTNSLCELTNTPLGVVNLTGIPHHMDKNPNFIGDAPPGGDAELDIGICTPFEAYKGRPCYNHPGGYFNIAAGGEDPVCMTTFTNYSKPWFWNGQAVQAEFNDGLGTSATVILECSAEEWGQSAIVQSKGAKEYVIVVKSSYACPSQN